MSLVSGLVFLREGRVVAESDPAIFFISFVVGIETKEQLYPQ
jgi:hypothetical protein